MTRTGILPLALTVTALLVTAGCSGSDDGTVSGKPPAASTAPAPTGTGPYPVPTNATAAPEQPRATELRQPKGGIPSPGGVDQADAGAISRAALTALMTYDTTVDSSRTEASLRTAAAGWCTASYGATLRATTSRSGTGAAWATWASHRAYTTVELTPADEAGRPADTATTAYRQWSMTVTPKGRDGWTGAPEQYAAFVELVRAAPGAPWRLNSLSLQ
ncbi:MULTISPECIES: hypothetical protein [unclassified Streptomyces]|uniref:hypothetical protein n=1 Tax=unclassified Streptomyces TaxID=2593676 RepID=UPI0038130A1B